MELGTDRETKCQLSRVVHRQHNQRKLYASGKLVGQELRETDFARDQNVRLLVADESVHPTSQRSKCSLAPCIFAKHLFLGCGKQWWEVRARDRQNVKRFKRIARDSGFPGLENCGMERFVPVPVKLETDMETSDVKQ